MINLQRYCANDSDPREYLWRPWRAGEFVYATNGHLAVRVPAADLPDAAENSKAPKSIADLFAGAFDGREARDFRAMPELPKLIKCLDCKGAGRLECAHGAEGSREQACESCLGLGYQNRVNGHTKIGDAFYSDVYLHMLGELPQCRVCPGEPASRAWEPKPQPAAFAFDGGQAILMPYLAGDC